MKHICITLVVFLTITACKKEQTVKSNTADAITTDQLSAVSITEHKVRPQTTDNAITTATIGNVNQYAYLPEQTGLYKNKLFVFFPGTIATPGKYLEILKSAARNGYHAIGIAYDNLSTIEQQSGETNDDTRTEKIFEEYLTGNNTSPVVTVPKPNGFENRISKMLQYLAAQYPGEQWQQFINADNSIRWETLSVAGHSQGADHTMYMAKKRNLYRAGFFSGTYSFKLQNGSYPSFILKDGLTPPQRIFGFTHIKDPVRVWDDVKFNWAALQLPGVPTSVDGGNDFTNTNRLVTKYKARFSLYHGITVADDATPVDVNNIPVFESVWKYMCYP